MNLQPLKDARRCRKKKLSVLAGELGVTRVTLGRYERGVAVPTADFLKRWAESLGLKIGFIQDI